MIDPQYYRPLNNLVIVTPAVDMGKVKHGNLEVHAPIGADGKPYDGFKSAPVVCKVIAAPRRLIFGTHTEQVESVYDIETTPAMIAWFHARRREAKYSETTWRKVPVPGSMEWRTTVQVKYGDVVWVNNNFLFNAENSGDYIMYEDKIHYIIPYQHLYMKKTGDTVTMLNGWVLVDLIENTPDWKKRAEKAGLIVPDIFNKIQYNDKFAVVKYIGEPVEYLFEDRYDYPEIQKGDVVMLKYKVNRKLEPGQKFFVCDGELRVTRRCNIEAIMDL